jgi:Condensation domain
VRNLQEQEAWLHRQIAGISAAPFSLAAGPLQRAVLYRVEDEKCVFVYVVHHIISDGWSMNVMARELMELYGAFAGGRPVPLQPLRIQYKDVAWRQRYGTGAGTAGR